MLDSIHRLLLLYLHCVAQTQCTEKQFLMYLRRMTNTELRKGPKHSGQQFLVQSTIPELSQAKYNFRH